MNKISADGVFMPDGTIHQRKVIVASDEGKIEAILDSGDVAEEEVRHFKGVLVPGFVNTHCHLELSHMKGKINTGTGLLPFIESVVKTRGATQEQIQDAIIAGDHEMYEDGIVAVGDISNQADTFPLKLTGRLRYYTFVECFDFMQDADAQTVFDQYSAVYDQLELGANGRKSFVPHAPYTVSGRLYELIRTANPDDCTISIHNQETPPENELFESKTGGFIEFYDSFDVSLDEFNATGKTSVHSALPHLNPNNRLLFVHNTLSTIDDINACHQYSDNVYWSTCANANLYIENRLPDYRNFLETNGRMTIGTDSLTSNWQLSILEEIKTINRLQSYVPLETLLTWATKNGAEALGYENELGTFDIGKTPGLVLIEGVENGKLTAGAKSKRIL